MTRKALFTFIIATAFSQSSYALVLTMGKLSLKVPDDWTSRNNYSRGVKFLSRSPAIPGGNSRAVFMVSEIEGGISKIDLKKAKQYQNLFKAKWNKQADVSQQDFEGLIHRELSPLHQFSLHTVNYKFKNRDNIAKTFFVKCDNQAFSFELVGKKALSYQIERAEKLIREMKCKK